MKSALLRFKLCTEPTCVFCDDDVKAECKEIREVLEVSPSQLRKVLGWKDVGEESRKEKEVKT